MDKKQINISDKSINISRLLKYAMKDIKYKSNKSIKNVALRQRCHRGGTPPLATSGVTRGLSQGASLAKGATNRRSSMR